MIFKGAAVMQEKSAYTIRTAKLNVPVPSVIRLIEYRQMPRRTRAVSRKGILLRDNSTCQYCGSQLAAAKLTMDHVKPRSRGGASTWENLVAACFGCNNKKSDRTPAEAGMTLAKVPRQISIHERHKLTVGKCEAWDRYLFAS